MFFNGFLLTLPFKSLVLANKGGCSIGGGKSPGSVFHPLPYKACDLQFIRNHFQSAYSSVVADSSNTTPLEVVRLTLA